MIKLFRNIHQNLLAEGKTTEYFKYAIGEIKKCPVREKIWVEKFETNQPRACRYDISYCVPKGTLNNFTIQ